MSMFSVTSEVTKKNNICGKLLPMSLCYKIKWPNALVNAIAPTVAMISSSDFYAFQPEIICWYVYTH